MNRSKGSKSPILILIGIILLLCLLGRSADSGGSALASTVASAVKVLLWGGGIIIVLLILFVVLIILAIVRDGSKKPGSKPQSGKDPEPAYTAQNNAAKLTPEQSEILKKGNQNLLELRKLNTNILNAQVKKGSSEICLLFESTLKILRQKPEQIPNARQCLNYYIPTFGEILEKFHSLESNRVLTEDMTQKVLNYLRDINSALTKLNTKLFEDDKLDMSVDMEAMSIAFRRDGLLDDPGMSLDLKL